MKRILFVDDEPRILDGLENLLFPYSDDWDMGFVTSGPEALEEMARHPFDIVVSDMRMPGMDGATLLGLVRDRHPDTVRIILSGHSELGSALRALPITHRFLSKPCPPELLVEVLQRTLSVQELVHDDAVRELVGRVGELPVQPAIYEEVARALADESTSLSEVAAIVERDIGISTKLLHAVNTAFFSRGQFIGSVRQAVPRLGSHFVRDLVLSAEVYRALARTRRGEDDEFSIERLHEHSFLTATVVSQLFDDKTSREEAFLAGMLHDVGKLILASALRQGDLGGEEGCPRHRRERAALGTTHAEVGAHLLGLWGLPYGVVEAVANHHEPQRSDRDRFGLAAALYVADVLCDELAGHPREEELDLDYLRTIGVAHRIDEWRALAAKAVTT